jgi:hypothetical protein
VGGLKTIFRTAEEIEAERRAREEARKATEAKLEADAAAAQERKRELTAKYAAEGPQRAKKLLTARPGDSDAQIAAAAHATLEDVELARRAAQ